MASKDSPIKLPNLDKLMNPGKYVVDELEKEYAQSGKNKTTSPIVISEEKKPADKGPSLTNLVENVKKKGVIGLGKDFLSTMKEGAELISKPIYDTVGAPIKGVIENAASANAILDSWKTDPTMKDDVNILSRVQTFIPVAQEGILDAENYRQELKQKGSADKASAATYIGNKMLQGALQGMQQTTGIIGAGAFNSAIKILDESGIDASGFLGKVQEKKIDWIKKGFKLAGMNDADAQQSAEGTSALIDLGLAKLGGKAQEKISAKLGTKVGPTIESGAKPGTFSVKGAKIQPTKTGSAAGMLTETLVQNAADIVGAIALMSEGEDREKALATLSAITLAGAVPLGKATDLGAQKKPATTLSYDDIGSYREMGGTPLEGKTNAWKQSRYDNLKKAFETEEQTKPIRISKDNQGRYQVDDGNHRFEVLKELGKPIKYIDGVTKEEGIIMPPDSKKTIGIEEPIKTETPAKVEEPMSTEPPIERYVPESEIPDKSYLKRIKNFVFENPTFGVRKFRTKLAKGVQESAYLNGIEIGEGGPRLDQTIQGIRSQQKPIASDVSNSFGLTKVVSGLNKEFGNKINQGLAKVDDSLFIGGKTPNAGTEISQGNVDKAKAAYESISTREDGDMIGMKNQDINNLGKIQYLIEINKERPEVLYPIFGKDVIDGIVKKMSDYESRITSSLGDDLVQQGFIPGKSMEEDYVRYVLDRGVAEKYLPEVLENKTPDGKVFDSIVDYRAHLKVLEQQGGEMGKRAAEQLSSLAKEKGGAEVDILRTHSPLIRTLDYIKNYSQLQTNDRIIKLFKQLSESKDERVRDYVSNIFGGKNDKGGFLDTWTNTLDTALGLKYKGSALQRLGWNLSALKLWGNIGNFIQSIPQSLGRAAIASKGDIFFKDISKAYPEMRKLGVVQGAEFTPVKGILGQESVGVWSGNIAESYGKVLATLHNMRDIAGIESRNAQDIVKGFKEWESKKASPQDVQKAYDKIFSDNNYIGNVGSLARSGSAVYNNLGFGALTNFNRGRVTQFVNNSLDAIQSVMKGEGKQALEFAKKPIGDIAFYVATFQAMKALAKSMGLNDDEQEVFADAHAQQLAGNPVSNARQLVTSLFSNLAILPVQTATQVLGSIKGLVQQGGSKRSMGIVVNDILDAAIKNVKALQEVRDIYKLTTGESLQDKIARLTGTVSQEGATASFKSKGTGKDSPVKILSRVLAGANLDMEAQNKLYNALDVISTGKEVPESIAPLVAYLKSTAEDTIRPLKDLGESFNIKDTTDRKLLASYANSTLNTIPGNKTFSDFLDKVGIPLDFKYDTWKSLKDDELSIRNDNSQIERSLGEFFPTESLNRTGTFTEFMNDMEEKNPVQFNNFIGSIAAIKKYIDENKITEATPAVIDEIKKLVRTSDTGVDFAISKIRGTDPVTTSFSDTLNNTLMRFSEGLAGKGLEEAKKNMQDVEDMFKIVADDTGFSTGLINSIANKSLALGDIVTKISQMGYDIKQFKNDYPSIFDFIRKGLDLRGEKIKKDELGGVTKPSTEGDESTGIETTEDSLQTKLNSLTGGLGQSKKKTSPLNITKALGLDKQKPVQLKSLNEADNQLQNLMKILGLSKR